MPLFAGGSTMSFSKQNFTKRRQKGRGAAAVKLTTVQWSILENAYDADDGLAAYKYKTASVIALVDRGFLEAKAETGRLYPTIAGKKAVADKRRRTKERRKLEIAFFEAWIAYG